MVDPIQVASFIISSLERSGPVLEKGIRSMLYDASSQYVDTYLRRHGQLKVLGMSKPISLKSIYVSVYVRDKDQDQSFESVEGLEKLYRGSRLSPHRGRNGQRSAMSDIEAADRHQRLMVLGPPGAGKSTFLRRVGLESLAGRKWEFEKGMDNTWSKARKCLPVFIELRALEPQKLDIFSVIESEFRICGFPDPERQVRHLLSQGELLVLLDGLDEIPPNYINQVTHKIRNFVDAYHNNRFIASCRIAFYDNKNSFRQFNDVVVSEFNRDQIKSFVDKWFHDLPKQRLQCWNALAEHESAKELAHTPLLLTMICILFRKAGRFPNNRAILFERALRVLLEEWDAEKEIDREQIYKELDSKKKEVLLADIAYKNLDRDNLFIPQRELASQIEDTLKNMLDDEPFINGLNVLKSIEIQHGILIPRSAGIYSFSHLSLQEYLSALYAGETYEQTETLVSNHLLNKQWREVFLLLAGLKKADDLLYVMEKFSRSQLTRKVESLLIWANESIVDVEMGNEQGLWKTTCNDGKYKPALKRLIACSVAFIFIYIVDRASDPSRNPIRYRDRILDLSLELAFNLVSPNSKLDLESILEPAFELIQDVDGCDDRDYELNIKLAGILNSERIFRFTIDLLDQPNPLVQQVLQNPEVGSGDTVSKSEEAPKNRPGNGSFPVLFKNWLRALRLPDQLIVFSKNDIKSLMNYLEANCFIYECKSAAVHVSPSRWLQIEGRMLKTSSPGKVRHSRFQRCKDVGNSNN